MSRKINMKPLLTVLSLVLMAPLIFMILPSLISFFSSLGFLILLAIAGVILLIYTHRYYFGNHSWLVANKESITILLLIVGVISTIFAAYFGASAQVQLAYQNDLNTKELEQKNFANMVYFDITNLNSTLKNSYNQIVNQSPNTTLIIVGDVYPSNGLYYSYRSEIATFDSPLAYNITLFYTDMMYADIYSKEMNSAREQINSATQQLDTDSKETKVVGGGMSDQHGITIIEAKKIVPKYPNIIQYDTDMLQNANDRYEIAKNKYIWAICDAYRLYPEILNTIHHDYNVTPSKQESRFQ